MRLSLHTPLLLICLLIGSSGPLSAQLLDHVQGELLVQLAPEREADKVFGRQPELHHWERLGNTLNLWTVRFDHTVHSARQLRQTLWQDPAVRLVQFNHFLQLRARPNDTRYDELWYFNNMGQVPNGSPVADINVEAAWDVTTGGATPRGDEIVVAILDDGIDLDHADLVGNLWTNEGEVPNNGIDDDGNGYIDDVHGYNVVTLTGDVAGNGDHGTPVAGMAGAVGNNARGVTGVNWSVSLLYVTHPDFISRESEAIRGYSYVLDQRRRYEATGGTSGAYVVAANSSFGIDRGNPDDSPIWCGLYDTLGQAGILSVGAAANLDIDVETEGDIPTRCTSDHLVGVTNVNAFDERVADAAFGATSIDLAAYGFEVLTTANGNGYARRSGTSFATPLVTGAVGLLYSADCATWNELVIVDPAAATLYLKDILLGTVRQLPGLDGQTATGGVLDVGAAMEELLSTCADCIPPTSLTVTAPLSGDNELIVDWNQLSSINRVDLRYRIQGTAEWTEITDVTAPFVIPETVACEVYEVTLSGRCAADDVANAPVVLRKSNGCCDPPSDVRLSPVSGPGINVVFTPQVGARRHRIRYRVRGTEEWTAVLVIGDRLRLNDLLPCTDYEVQVATNCSGAVDSDFSPLQVITSFGCGSCNDVTYCTPFGLDNEEEWIAGVNFGNIIVSQSGPSADGYLSYGDVGVFDFAREAEYPLTLLPGPDGLAFSGQFRVWIDWNQNGIFSEEELVYAGNSTPGPQPARGEVTVPDDAVLGLTRMRVFYESIAHRESPCASSDRERTDVEDYCLQIVASAGCPPPPSNVTATYDPQTGRTTVDWAASTAPGGTYVVRYRRLGTQPWNELLVNGLSSVFNFDLCGEYELELASQCAGGPGPVRPLRFGENCTGTDDERLPDAAWSVAPNPVGEVATLRWSADLEGGSLAVYTAAGRRVLDVADLRGGQRRLSFATLPGGVYWLRMVSRDGRSGVRRVVRR